MLVHAKIQKWGNGLALRVSGMVRDIPNFQEGTEVDIEVSELGLTVTKVKSNKRLKLPFNEAQLLKGLNQHTGHADALATLLPSEHEDK